MADRNEEIGKESDVERVEILASRAEGRDDIDEDGLGGKLSALAASTEEEVDALRINLMPDDELPSTSDGTGRVVDDTAEERLARFTEADPMRSDIGALSVTPGRADTSAILRSHDLNTTSAVSDALAEGNLDEPMDETITERKERI